ncbi:MAG: membrane protein insertase YidC [Woeseiaceae bacterium]
MDNQRLFIWAIFGVLAWMTYQAWVETYAPAPALAPTEVSSTTGAAEEGLPEIGVDELTGDDSVPAAPAEVPALDPQAQSPEAVAAKTISVQTDVLQIEISSLGGTLQSAVLSNYPVAKDRPDELVRLLNAAPDSFAVIQSGVISRGGKANATHKTAYPADRLNFDMGSYDEVVVPLTWTNESGVTFTKSYRFARGSYIIELEQTVSNNSEAAWEGTEYVQLDRRLGEWERSMFDVDSYSFNGPIAYDGEKAEKLQRDDLLDDGPYKYSATDGWFGAIQHHFVAAVVPENGTEQNFEVVLSSASDTTALARSRGAIVSVPPGQSHSFNTTLFVGPKLQSQLEQVDEKLKLTVDYGWLTMLSQPLFWLLSAAFGIFGNWGVAIIAVTILIKLVFYKLTESSGRSMAKMRNLQPRIKAIQERYKEDKPAQSQAMMDLYKTEKVNPAAGCLPILIQMPFFLAFYWVLLESVEMRQAPFMLWITDLSVRDPFFILPLIMGAAMFFQQKLNPQVGDPVQVKVMQIMPIIFTAFFAFFPSGLVLYWVTNTLLSIAQQWKINKVVEKESKQQKGGKRPKKA